MKASVDEKTYDTPTAKFIYRLRDLFVNKGSVFTAQSLHLGPAITAVLFVLLLVAGSVYRISRPVGANRTGPGTGLALAAPTERLKVERPPAKAPHEDTTKLPSTEEVLRVLAGAPADGEPTKPSGPGRPGSPPGTPHGPVGPYPYGAPYAGPPAMAYPTDEGRAHGADRPSGGPPAAESGHSPSERREMGVESTLAFEKPPAAGKEAEDTKTPEYEYVRLIEKPAADAGITGPEVLPAGHKASPASGRTREAARAEAPESLFQEVRVRLMNRIDTSIPNALVVAEIAREADVGGFRLRRGDRLVGRVSLSTARRVDARFTRLVDTDNHELAVDALALDLAGATGLRSHPADGKLKRAGMYANDRALDYIRAFRGPVAIYSNPAQADLRTFENKARIVDPDTEFYVVFNAIKNAEEKK